MLVTIKFSTNTMTLNLPDNATVGDVIQNASYQAVGGWDASVEGVIEGESVPRARALYEGETVTLRKVANTKA